NGNRQAALSASGDRQRHGVSCLCSCRNDRVNLINAHQARHETRVRGVRGLTAYCDRYFLSGDAVGVLRTWLTVEDLRIDSAESAAVDCDRVTAPHRVVR